MKRTMFRTTDLLCCAVWVIAIIQAGPVHAAENAWSVEFLNARKSEWEQLLFAPIKLEGRMTLSGRNQFKLAKCEINFMASEETMRSLAVKKGSVELTGRFKKDDGKLYFDVDQIRSISSDVEQYNSRTAKFRNPRPEDWYALGDWATERSRFYDDAELAKKAVSAYEHGISVASRNLAPDDSTGRFELANKITRFKLPDTRRMELMHEGYLVRRTVTSKTSPGDQAAWKKLSDELLNDLPGAGQPLGSAPADLMERYEKDPLVVYRDAADKLRRQLHRLLYVSIIRKLILIDAEPDGRNGDAIAEQLEKQIPEAANDIEKYRNLKLSWRLERAATATRDEIEQLARDFRSRNYPEAARHALQTWLTARESRLREDGALGLLQLAEDYLSLLKDEQKAVSLLMEAHRRDPAFQDVSVKLRVLGYNLIGGTWIKGAPAPAPVAVHEVPSGAIAPGMTASQLIQTMGGRPGSVTRVHTKKGIAEVWSYLPLGTSRLIVRLERASTGAEAIVIDSYNEK